MVNYFPQKKGKNNSLLKLRSGCLPALIPGDGWGARPVFVPFIHSFINPSNIYSPTALSQVQTHTKYAVCISWLMLQDREKGFSARQSPVWVSNAALQCLLSLSLRARSATTPSTCTSVHLDQRPPPPPYRTPHQPPQHNKWAGFLITWRNLFWKLDQGLWITKWAYL